MKTILPSDATNANNIELSNIPPTLEKVDRLSPKEIPIINTNRVLNRVKTKSLAFRTGAFTSLPKITPISREIITVNIIG